MSAVAFTGGALAAIMLIVAGVMAGFVLGLLAGNPASWGKERRERKEWERYRQQALDRWIRENSR